MTVEQLVDVTGCASCLVKKMLVFELIVPAVEPVRVGQFIIDDFIGPEKQFDFPLSRFGTVRAVNKVVSFRAAKVPTNSTRLGIVAESSPHHFAGHIYNTLSFPDH